MLEPPKAKAGKTVDRDVIRLQDELSDVLGAVVAIQSARGGRGKLVIAYDSLDQLDGIVSRIRP